MTSIAEVFEGAAKGLVGNTIEKGLEIVNKLVGDKDLKTKLEYELNTLQKTQEQQVTLAKIDFEKSHEASEERIQVEQQRTFQAEVNQSDLETKRARPRMAMRSFNISALYAFLSNAGQVYIAFNPQMFMGMTGESIDTVISLLKFNWDVYLVLAAPALTYMGVRSLDIWRRGGAKEI